MKFINCLTSLSVILGLSFAADIHDGVKSYDFKDTEGTEYRLCSLKSADILKPKSPLEETCAQFMEKELNDDDNQKNAKTQKPTESDAVIPYFNRFIEKASKLESHRLLVLFQKTEDTLIPLGMGRVNCIEETRDYTNPETIKSLEPFGGCKNGYVVGGTMSKDQQDKKISSKVIIPIADIILKEIYKDLHTEKNPPFIYVFTDITNDKVNHICKKVGFQRLTGDGGLKVVNTALNLMMHDYVYPF